MRTPTMGRNYRAEVYSPTGRWMWGQWVSGRDGYGTLTDRLERAAMAMLGCEPADSTVRVFRYVPHSLDPMQMIVSLSTPTPE